MLPDGSGNSENFVFGKHSDVLSSTPKDEQSRMNLMEECKRRGNMAFKACVFQEAEVLYTKAIEMDPTSVTLYSNRSAARCSMGKIQLALEDANECIKINAAWAKGYFRQGQALSKLKQHSQATLAFQKVLEIDPSDKLALKLVDAEKKAAEACKDVESEKITTKAPKTAQEKTMTTKKSISRNKVDDTIEPLDVNEDNLGTVRGYKKLADGRVTTYFNNDLTEEARELIGDIAPKRIECASQAQIENVEGGSAWNTGASFEEKDLTQWAKDRIKELFGSVEYQFADGTIVVEKVGEMDGDASIAVFRGKKRYIFAFSFEVECKWEEHGVEGKLKFLDLSSDCGGDYDIEAIVPDRYKNEITRKFHQLLNSKQNSIQSLLLKKVDQFVQEYQSM